MTDPSLDPPQWQDLATAGQAAPSFHNTQPWTFRALSGAQRLQVYADTRRALPAGDPDGRALHISVGAALFNIRVAAERLGWEPSVRLLPDAAKPFLLAEIDLLARAPGAEPHGPDLYPAIWQRHSSRQPFANRDVPEAVLGELIEAARAEGADFCPLEEADVRRVMDLTAEAEERINDDPARRAETQRWLRGREKAPDGIPADALGPPDREAHVPMRSFTGTPPAPGVRSERFEPLPQLATLTTHGDEPADWLRVGQAVERVWLLATVHGLRAGLLQQAVEWPDTRWGLRDPTAGPGHVQTVMRLGFGPPGPLTGRRPVADVLELVDESAHLRTTEHG
ncbi:Acg family FMN-binding oxidoreductase [Kitasatospora sp. NPDC053057]|uniref:Acg family FMN-binding oxidoreductase n=1 Tax=Kitasatospora sp. NPDC053057 TaxID=3364062 RepID=UPI0037C5764A